MGFTLGRQWEEVTIFKKYYWCVMGGPFSTHGRVDNRIQTVSLQRRRESLENPCVDGGQHLTDFSRESEDLIRMAQNKDQRRGHLNMVMNHGYVKSRD
jgi:hypothetical protein